MSGDVTDQVQLWDAGSEIDQEPGLGADQVQRQAAANTGAADPDNTVREAVDTFGNLPAVSDVISVTLTPTSDTGWTVRVEMFPTRPRFRHLTAQLRLSRSRPASGLSTRHPDHFSRQVKRTGVRVWLQTPRMGMLPVCRRNSQPARA